MFYSYRIIKYSLIKESDFLSSSEWTSYYDVGDKVTLDEYLIVEQRYIDTVLNLCKCFGVRKLRISELEINNETMVTENIVNNREFNILELTTIIRLILREYIWCKLVCETCEFHFGYDYYMYFVSRIDPEKYLEHICKDLNITKLDSPYISAK